MNNSKKMEGRETYAANLALLDGGGRDGHGCRDSGSDEGSQLHDDELMIDEMVIVYAKVVIGVDRNENQKVAESSQCLIPTDGGTIMQCLSRTSCIPCGTSPAVLYVHQQLLLPYTTSYFVQLYHVPADVMRRSLGRLRSIITLHQASDGAIHSRQADPTDKPLHSFFVPVFSLPSPARTL